MAKGFSGVLLAGFLIALAATAGADCPRPGYGTAFLKPLPQTGIDQALFAEALRQEANFARCGNGVGALAAADGLTRTAAGHAAWMATERRLVHDGDQRFRARMRASDVKFKLAAENIASHERYAFGAGPFKILSRASCRFTSESGTVIPAHSYASLARQVVAGWMASSGHRRNLLNRRLTLAGAGIGFDASADFCGRYYISQAYSG